LLAALFAVPAFAASTGPATIGTILSDPGSGFTVQVTGTSGVSFGTITLVNDALSFTPAAFNSGVVTGPATNQMTGTITLLLQPGPNGVISSAWLNEIGDYWLNGSGTIGAAFQLVARNASGNINASQIIENTNTANTQGASPLGPTGAFNLTAWGLSGSVASGSPTGWQSTVNGDVIVTIQNNLFWSLASTQSGFIEKKDAGMTMDVTVVPLPAAAWLLLSALGGLGAVFRRRRT
jgi:hypothetical protein